MASAIGLFLVLVVATAWAAPAPTAITANVDNDGGSSSTTAAFAVTANKLYTMAIGTRLASGNGANTPTITCHGTWTIIKSDPQGSGPENKLFLFRLMLGSSSGSAACTIDFASQAQSVTHWSVVEWDAVDTSGSNGAGAIVQSVTNGADTGTTASAALAAYGSTDNRPYAVTYSAVTAAITEESGWTELSETLTVRAMEDMWRTNTADTSPSTTVSNGVWIMVAIEVKAAASACRSSMLTGVGGC